VLVVKARGVDFAAPFSVAVMVTVVFNALLATAANCAVAEPANTVTNCGTTTAMLLLLTVTVVAVAAAAFNVRVQVLEEAPDTGVGLQASDVSVGMVNVTLADFEAPFSVAVTVTMAFNALPAVTENCAEV